MRISLNGAFRNYDASYGYGVAADQIVKGLARNNIEYDISDYNAPIEIFWGHPPYEFNHSQQYKIGYTAWESTGFKDGWIESMKDANEIWTPSSWLSDHFAKSLDMPTFTFPHGIDTDWKPVKRQHPHISNEPFRFIHTGEPQFRKNGQLVVDAFAELFGNDEKYQLVMKTSGINTTRIFSQPSNSIVGSPDLVYRNIILVDALLEKEKLINLHNRSHAMIYPTAGEGFGFHPLEALASGLPTITTIGWCDYKDFVTVPIDSPMSPSPWEDMHPGNMFQPTKEQIKSAMIDMVENYDKYIEQTFKNAFIVHKEWNWDRQIKKAVNRLEEIEFSRILSL